MNRSAWIAPLGLVLIAVVTAAPGWALSTFLADCMLKQEARLTHDFVDNIVHVEEAGGLFTSGSIYKTEHYDLFVHLAKMPDVLRVNLYSQDLRIIWSTEPALIGLRGENNRDLDEAMGGRLFAYGDEHVKPQHSTMSARYRRFIEVYSPVRDERTGQLIGVVEVYRAPRILSEAISTAQRAVWTGSAMSALLLCAAFFLMLRGRLAERPKDLPPQGLIRA